MAGEVNPVRVTLRNGQVTRIKRCKECKQDKVVHEEPAMSQFAINGRRPNGTIRGWKPTCKACYAAQVRAQRRADPEGTRAKEREAYERLKQDPERMAVWRDYQREYARRRREVDEEFRRRCNERDARFRARKRAEDPLYFSPRRVRERSEAAAIRAAEQAAHDQAQPRIPAEPFREWLIAYMAQTDTIHVEAVASALGLVPRRVRSVLEREYERVALDIVDQALLACPFVITVNGREVITFNDLYVVEDEEEAAGW
jgi:hypothetical protein